MKISALNSISRLYFGYEDIARALAISMDILEKHEVFEIKDKDFKVKLGSIVDSNARAYYTQNRFSYLMEKLRTISLAEGI